MLLESKIDRSVYFFMKNLFIDAPFIHIVDGYPELEIDLPTVAVENASIDTYPFEIGNRNRIEYRIFNIDVFAKDKAQRDEYGYRIINALEEGIDVYDYDEGFPPDFSPTKLGKMIVDTIEMEIIKIYPELVSTMYYRSTVKFSAFYSII
jgi:hypothetical protein